MNSISQKILEAKVVDAVLKFYKPYFEKDGRRKLAQAIKTQVNLEDKELTAARQKAKVEHEKIGRIINNLLDNITPTNREFVDQRMIELKQQKQQVEIRLEEFDRLFTSQNEINGMVTDSMEFLSGLGFIFRQGLPQEKLAALRQCIERIWINRPAGEIKLDICLVPTGNLRATQEIKTAI